MKRLKYLLIAGVSLLLTSCENFLDRQPESSLSGETFWTSEQDLKTWNAGMYDGCLLYTSGFDIECSNSRNLYDTEK